MKLTVSRDAFQSAITWATRGLPTRPVSPILAGIKITVTGGEATVYGFDYETSAQATFGLDAGDNGTIVVPGRLLAEIAKMLPPFPVEITEDGTRATLTCGKAEFTLALLPVDEYPALPELPAPLGAVGADAWATAIAQVAPAVGRDDTLPALTGIRVEFRDDTVHLVSTDRYRLATALAQGAWTPEPREDGEPLEVNVLVPGKTLHDAARGMTGDTVLTIYVAEELHGNLVGLAGDGRRLTTRVLAGDFPKYQSLVPPNAAAVATVPCGDLTDAIKRAALVIERNAPVRLQFTPEHVVVEGGSSDESQSSETLADDVTLTIGDPDAIEAAIPEDADSGARATAEAIATYARHLATGKTVTISFNPQYLLDAITPLAGGPVRFRFSGEVKPAIIDGDGDHAPGYQTILVPIRSAG